MTKHDTTSALIDGILGFTVTTSALAAGLVIPNLMIALDKPLEKFWKQLDKRERERAIRRAVSYMKTYQLITGDYQHGLRITAKGRQRLEKSKFDQLKIEAQNKWDKRWRLIIYDIPESHKIGRNALTFKLHQLGFYQLQRSAWLHPFACREVMEQVTARYDINRYVSYIETASIENQQIIIDRFKKKYPSTSF